MKIKMNAANYRKYKDCVSVLSEVRKSVVDKDIFSAVSGLSKTKIRKIERISDTPSIEEFRTYCLTILSFHLIKNDTTGIREIS